MPRSPRIEFPGACYHIMNRGNHLEPIFQDDADRALCWEVLAETCQSAGWSLHSFVFMSNHYHLLIETHRATLVKGMQYFNSTYTHRYNRRHQTRGHLFQGRYKAVLVDHKSPTYFLTVSDYIHLNPVRRRRPRTLHAVLQYPWSSAGWFAGTRTKRPACLAWERIYGELGLEAWDRRTRCTFQAHLERRCRDKGEPAVWHTLRRGWCVGSETFVGEMKDRVVDRLDAPHEAERWTGPDVEEAEEARALRLVRQGRERWGVRSQDVLKGRDRYLLARWVRTHTKVGVKWLAAQVGVKTRGGLVQGIYRVGQALKEDRRLQRRWTLLGEATEK